jgi:hypothetical protein
MKKIAITTVFGLALAIGLGFGFIPGMEQSAFCAECESDNLPGIRKAFQAFDAECQKQLEAGEDQRKGCFASNVYNKVVPIMKALSKDNRFGKGDRILLVGETQNGNLIAGADRGFQTVAPLDSNSLTIKLNKTDGGNGALVKICSVDENGTQKRIGTLNFAENNETGEKEVTVTGVQGKIVHVDIHSFGGVVKKFKYTLKTSK